MRGQSRWQRITLLVVLAYEGLGALVGGGLLVASPDGRYMDMPVEIMHGTFRDFLIPGAILGAMGLLTGVSFFSILRRWSWDWLGAAVAIGGWIIWYTVEIAILRSVHWLHAMWGLPVLLGAAMVVPMLPTGREALHRLAFRH